MFYLFQYENCPTIYFFQVNSLKPETHCHRKKMKSKILGKNGPYIIIARNPNENRRNFVKADVSLNAAISLMKNSTSHARTPLSQ